MNLPSEKSYAVAACLSAVFGVIGIQHFYLGRHGLGIIDLTLSVLALFFFINGQFLLAFLFFAIDFVHTLVITIMLLTGTFRDGKGRLVCYPGQKLA